MNIFTILAENQQKPHLAYHLRQILNKLLVIIMQLRLAFFIVLTTSIQLFSAPPVKSQAIDKVEIKLELKNESLVKAFQKIEKQSQFQFMYRYADVKDINKLELSAEKMSIADILKELLSNTSLDFKQVDNRIMIISSDKKISNSGLSVMVERGANELDIVVRGQVIDNKGETLPGVSVKVKGSDVGASTDLDGRYSLNVPDNAILVFTYIGYISKEVIVNNQSTLNVTLESSSTSLSEVVVTALGIKREAKSLTYSSQTVSTKELSEARSLNVVNSLQGKVAGMSISTAGTGLGGGARVILRGNRSLTGDSQPLYVIDGVPVSGGLDNMSPDNIESINVLKGPSAAALYGSAAQNGVIIVETKKGGQDGVVKVSLNNTFTVGQPLQYLKAQNIYGQGVSGVYNRTIEEAWGPRMDGAPVAHWSNDPKLVGTTIPFSPQPDNFKDVFSNSFNMSNNLLATVGSKNSQTAFAYTREDASGVLKSNKLGRHDLTLRITNQLTKWLSLDTKLNYIQQSLDNPNSTGDDAFFNPFRNIYRMPRNIRVADLQQFEYTDAAGNNRQNFWNPGSTSGKNPYWIMNRILTLEQRKRIIGLASLNINLTKDIDMIVRTSYDGGNFSQERKVYNDTYGSTYDFGFYGVQKSNNVQWNSDAIISYKKQLNKDFNVNALVGGTIRTQGGEGSMNANTTQQLIVPNFFALGNTQIPAAGFRPSNETQTQSVFFSGNFGFKNAIYLDVTGRNDWSSTLPVDSRSYFYPSVGISTVLTDLIPTLPKVLSYAKLRASWAMVGNSAPPHSLSRFATLGAGGNNGFVTLGGTIPNADLKPERTESAEIGLDVRFFEGRLGLDLTAYKSNTYDQLFTIALPIGSGAADFFTNGGDVENKGIEAIIRGTPIQTSNFIWDATANFATNRNWVNRISDNRPYLIVGGDSYMSDFVVQQGYEFGDRYTRGWRRDDQGRVIVGANGMPLFTPGRTVNVANFNPDWMGGVSNTFSYKNFSASFLIEHRQGGTFVSTTDGVLDGEGITERTLNGREGGLIFGENLFPNETAVLANGSPNNIALNAQTFWRGVGGRNTPIGEAFLEDATNTRLREFTLGYNLPKSMLRKLGIISNVKLSVVGRNLFFFQRSGNWDPEILTSTAPAAEGLQAFVPPTERNYGFNLKIDF